MVGRQFGDEARRDRGWSTGHRPARLAAWRIVAAPPRAGDRRHRRGGVPPPGDAAPPSSSARWLGNTPSSQPARKTWSNSSPLAAWSVMMVTFSVASDASLSMTRLTCSRKAGQRRVILHRAGSSMRFSSRPVGSRPILSACQHRDIARFLQHDARQLGMRQVLGQRRASARDRRSSPAASAARAGRSSSVSTSAAAACGSGRSMRAGMAVHPPHRLVAQPALGHVDDALERQRVIGLRRRGADRPAHRGFRRARRSGSRRRSGRAGRSR